MRTFVVYKEQSDHARAVDTFMHDFTRQTGRVIEIVNPETPEGAHLCATYDIVEYPSLVALDDDGILQNIWRGLPLPTISEVSYYAK
jgi:hypothetical protein